MKVTSPKTRKNKRLCQIYRCTKVAKSAGFCREHWLEFQKSNEAIEISQENSVKIYEDVMQVVDWAQEGAAFIQDLCEVLKEKLARDMDSTVLDWRTIFQGEKWADDVDQDSEVILERIFKNLGVQPRGR